MPTEKSTRRGLGRATLLLSAATFLSRILGLCREQAFAALLGAGFYGDAFTMAFRLPNLLRDLFAEGALSAAFQPAFMQRLKQGGRQQAYDLANLVQTTLILVVGVLVAFGVIFAPQLVATWARGYSAIPGKTELTVLLTRIMMPFLLLVSLASVVMGMLNAEERFAWPALAPALFNLAALLAGVLLFALHVRHNQAAAVGWAVATLLGGALQFAVQLPALWRTGYRFVPRLDLRFADPGLQKVLLTMAPATIGLMATQVNIYISSSFASGEDGAVTWLNVAFRLLQLPIGIFGVSVGTVALARFAGSTAGLPLGAGKTPDAEMEAALEEVRDTLRRGLRMVAFLTLPTSVGLWLLAEPIIAVIYQHGAFRHGDTLHAAAALRYYVIGLFAYAAVKVVAPVFYALKAARIPVFATVVAVSANVIFNLLCYQRYGYRILALGTSVAALCNFLVLCISFQLRHGGLWHRDLLLALARMVIASGLMGAVVAAADAFFASTIATPASTIATLIRVSLSIGTGGLAYALLCYGMRLSEVRVMAERVGKRLRRRR